MHEKFYIFTQDKKHIILQHDEMKVISTYTGSDSQVFWWEIQLRFPSSRISEGTEQKDCHAFGQLR